LKREDAIFAIVGNKLDLAEKRQVYKEDGEALAMQRGYIFHEVSAKTGQNINNLFYKDIFDSIIMKFKMLGAQNDEFNQNIAGMKLGNGHMSSESTQKNKKSCCKI
jgi:Ras-related protein Rab-5C